MEYAKTKCGSGILFKEFIEEVNELCKQEHNEGGGKEDVKKNDDDDDKICKNESTMESEGRMRKTQMYYIVKDKNDKNND